MTTDARVRYCPYCGQQAASGWMHCPACGKRLESIVSDETASGPSGDWSTVLGDRWGDAILRLRLGELDKAHECLSSLLLDNPENPKVLALLGSVCLRQYRVEEAQRYLEQAAALDPDSAFVRLKLAEYWLALGIPTRAFEEIAKAEAGATDDIPLLIHIRSFSKDLRAKTRGNVLREPPALPHIGVPGIIKRMRQRTSVSESK